MTAGAWPTNRGCVTCGSEFFPKSTVQVYCSPTCRERAKYDRIRNDPDKWAAYLAKEREKYTPKQRGPERLCGIAGCGEKHLARDMCQRHYRRARYREGHGRKPVPISALVKHYDLAGEFIEEPTHRLILAIIAPPLVFAECPDCGKTMYRLPTTEHDLRDCGSCRVRVMLNEEEVEWLTSEARSIERPTQTPN